MPLLSDVKETSAYMCVGHAPCSSRSLSLEEVDESPVRLFHSLGSVHAAHRHTSIQSSVLAACRMYTMVRTTVRFFFLLAIANLPIDNSKNDRSGVVNSEDVCISILTLLLVCMVTITELLVGFTERTSRGTRFHSGESKSI